MHCKGSKRRRKKKKNGGRNLLEDIIAENFLNLGKETGIQIQKAQRSPNKINPRRFTSQMVIKMANSSDQERILKEAREKNSYIQGKPHRAISGLFRINFAGQKGVT